MRPHRFCGPSWPFCVQMDKYTSNHTKPLIGPFLAVCERFEHFPVVLAVFLWPNSPFESAKIPVKGGRRSTTSPVQRSQPPLALSTWPPSPPVCPGRLRLYGLQMAICWPQMTIRCRWPSVRRSRRRHRGHRCRDRPGSCRRCDRVHVSTVERAQPVTVLAWNRWPLSWPPSP